MVRLFTPLLACALFFGCFEPPTETTSDLAVLVGEAGGTVEGPGIVLEIPAGALSGDTLIRATRFRTLPAGIPGRVLGDAWLIQPEGLLFGKPVRLELALKDGNANRVQIATAPADTTRFELLNATHTEKTATTAITHLSIFVPVTEEDADAGQTDGGVMDAGIIPTACSPAPATGGCLAGDGGSTRSCTEPTPVGCNGEPTQLEVSATHLVWSTSSGGVVARRRSDSGSVRLSSSGAAFSLAIDADRAFWLAGDGMHAASLDGGSATVLVAGGVTEGDTALSATHVYWTTGPLGIVARVPKSGGAAELVATNETAPRAIALDATNVYWVAGTNLRRAPLGGGAATTVMTLPAGQNRGLTIAGGNLYWVNDQSRTILRAPVSGGTATPLAQGADTYFFTDGTSLIYSVPDLPSRATSTLWSQASVGGVSTKLLQLNTHAPVALDPGSFFFSAGGLWRLSR